MSIRLKLILTLAVTFLVRNSGTAQAIENHTINLSKDAVFVESGHAKQGSNIDPSGVRLDLNNYYLRKGGKPILPIMGEFHYSRYPRGEWEQSLLQMKAAGIQTIALYSFWIHHEEEEGKFRFDDNRDVRYFLQLCVKHHLTALVRIGPWVHGEARNGGYPDWYVKKKLKSAFDRSTTDGSIQPEVVRWYAELAKQFKGLYYKDGGPIIALQVDNEVRSNGPKSGGYQYLVALKALAVKLGMDVPYYVVTGWPGPVVPEDDVMPLWGGYADAPWSGNTKELPPNALYTFISDRKDKNIGNDVNTYGKENEPKPVYRHPFLTVELGSGIQPTYLRRPVLSTPDIMGLIYTRLGTGANMLGYYVFHGTQHPLSWHQEYSTQESKASYFPYPNDYPAISYDFEAPISEWGYLRPYYHDLKLLHEFISGYAEKLAPMTSTIPSDNPMQPNDLVKLRYGVRSNGRSGFVFFNNYVRNHPMDVHNNVSFTIQTEKESIRIPEKGGLAIRDSAYGLFPFNDNAGGVLIKYATVHPAAVLGNSTFFYYAIEGIDPEFKLDNSTFKDISLTGGRVVKAGKFTFLNELKPGTSCVAEITTIENQHIKLIILTKEEARYSYLFDVKGSQMMLISKDQVFYDDVKDKFTIRSIDQPNPSFFTFPAFSANNRLIHAEGASGVFQRYSCANTTADGIKIPYSQVSDDRRLKNYIGSTLTTPSRPTYGIDYSDSLAAKAYRLDMPKQIPSQVYDMLLSVNYSGNTAALYANGKLLADNYYAGEPMNISLKRIENTLPAEHFVFQITPLLKNSSIYFEPKTYLDFKNAGFCGVNNIVVHPVYEVTF